MKTLNILLFTIFMFSTPLVFAQKRKETKEHKVVFHLSTSDTLAYKALTKQLNNILAIWPTAKIEVVVHNKGMSFVLKDKSQFEPEIRSLTNQGVAFVVCENSMKQQKVSKEQILPMTLFVPSGLVEIIKKQEAGWAYIKAGF